MAVSRTADAFGAPAARRTGPEPGHASRRDSQTRAVARRLRRLRPSGFDDLGLRRALPDRMLPGLVGAMAFLAALALAGAFAADGLARHWQTGAGVTATIQVPHADGRTAAATVLDIVRGTPGIARARGLGDEEVAELIRPWLGRDVERLSLPLPNVIEVRLSRDDADNDRALDALRARLESVAPGTLVEAHAGWALRLGALARSLEAAAWLVLALVGGVAVAVVAIGTRAGLLARREAIEIVHDLGAPDRWIARRFSHRATILAAGGGLAGTTLAVPVLVGLSALIAPFAQPAVDTSAGFSPGLAATVTISLGAIPTELWLALLAIPPTAAAIGWLTAATTVRRWLGRLV